MNRLYTVLAAATCVFAAAADADETGGLATGKRQHEPITVTRELDKASPELADAATGLPTGKRRHEPVTATKELDKASPKSADAATGLPTGKRQHRPVSVVKPIDKATPKLHPASGDDEDVASKTNKSEAARARRPD